MCDVLGQQEEKRMMGRRREGELYQFDSFLHDCCSQVD